MLPLHYGTHICFQEIDKFSAFPNSKIVGLFIEKYWNCSPLNDICTSNLCIFSCFFSFHTCLLRHWRISKRDVKRS